MLLHFLSYSKSSYRKRAKNIYITKEHHLVRVCSFKNTPVIISDYYLHCMNKSLTTYLHCTHLRRVTAPTRSPALNTATLVNDCLYQVRCGRFMKHPINSSPRCITKDRCLVHFWWRIIIIIIIRDVMIKHKPVENRFKYVMIQNGWDAKQIAIQLGVGVYMNVCLRGTYCL